MVHWVGVQGQVTSAKKVWKHAPIKTLPTENTKPKTKKYFFQSDLDDLLNA